MVAAIDKFKFRNTVGTQIVHAIGKFELPWYKCANFHRRGAVRRHII
jgi:hypothetical protein